MAQRKMLSLKEAATEMGVHVETVRRWCRDERVPYYRVGSLIRICLEDLRIEARKHDGRQHLAQRPPTADNT